MRLQEILIEDVEDAARLYTCKQSCRWICFEQRGGMNLKVSDEEKEMF